MRKIIFRLASRRSRLLRRGARACSSITCLGALLLSLAAAGCSDDDGIDSNEEARRAYLGLDSSIEKCLDLGFAGFNAASSANIDPQAGLGEDTGTLTITGQVDQGSSDNKGMRLHVGMVDYSDGVLLVETSDGNVEVELTYDTSEVDTEQPYLDLSLRDIPAGTISGTLTGTYYLSGDLGVDVTLDLAMSGMIEDAGGGAVSRVPGSMTITGTATSGDGLYEVDVTL